jgi:hypothetical protein
VAIEYVHAITGGNLTFKWEDAAIVSEIHVGASVPDLLVQDLIDGARAAEASDQGRGYGQIARASGKQTLGTGVAVGITLELLGGWRVYSTKSSGVFTVLGGNLVKGDGSSPFRPNNLITYVNLLSAAATIVTSGGGGGGDGFNASDRTNLGEIKAVTDSIGSLEALVNAVWGGETGIRPALAEIKKGLENLKTTTSTILSQVRQILVDTVRKGK